MRTNPSCSCQITTRPATQFVRRAWVQTMQNVLQYTWVLWGRGRFHDTSLSVSPRQCTVFIFQAIDEHYSKRHRRTNSCNERKIWPQLYGAALALINHTHRLITLTLHARATHSPYWSTCRAFCIYLLVWTALFSINDHYCGVLWQNGQTWFSRSGTRVAELGSPAGFQIHAVIGYQNFAAAVQKS